MRNITILLFLICALISGCSSVADLGNENEEYITHFRCLNKDKTKEHYLVNEFHRKPTIDEKKWEMALAKHRIEKQLHIELIDCETIAAEDVPNGLDKP